MTENLDRLRELLAYYGSLDKTTVLALINRTEAAEREATAAKSVLARHITERSLELHRTAGLAVDTAVEAVVKLLVEDSAGRAGEAEARAQAAERALDFHTQRDRELKMLLSMLSDRLDEFCYDELFSLIDDEPLNQWSESYTSKLQAAEAAVQRVRELCVDTAGNPIDPDFDGNTVGDIRRALDGGEYEARVVEIEILPEVGRIPALLDEANRELARSSQFQQRGLRNLGLDLTGSVSDEGESFLRRHDNSGVRQIVEKHFQEDR